MRVPHASSSSRENALSSESIGTRCSTGANVDAGRPPGRCVGESGVTSVGMLRLELAQLADERVELGVGDLGLVEDEVPLVVVLDQLAQLRDAQLVGCSSAGLDALRVSHDASLPTRLRQMLRRRWRAWWRRRDRARGRRSRGRAASCARPGSRRDRRDRTRARRAPATQPRRIAAAAGQLAPRVEQRLPQRLPPARRPAGASGSRPRSPSRRRRGTGRARRRRRGRARRRRSGRAAGRRRARGADRPGRTRAPR